MSQRSKQPSGQVAKEGHNDQKTGRPPGADHDPWVPRWVPTGVFVLATVVLFAEFIFSREMLFGGDTLSLGYMARAFFAERLAAGDFPLWSPRLLGWNAVDRGPGVGRFDLPDQPPLFHHGAISGPRMETGPPRIGGRLLHVRVDSVSGPGPHRRNAGGAGLGDGSRDRDSGVSRERRETHGGVSRAPGLLGDRIGVAIPGPQTRRRDGRRCRAHVSHNPVPNRVFPVWIGGGVCAVPNRVHGARRGPGGPAPRSHRRQPYSLPGLSSVPALRRSSSTRPPNTSPNPPGASQRP